MPVQLQSPIAQAPIANVTVVNFQFRLLDTPIHAIGTYIASDANDVPVPGAEPFQVTHTLAGIAAFYQAGAHPKLGALAALAVDMPAYQGASS
jgi:hypothetical protein